MSRSVKMDYDKLRAPKPVPEFKLFKLGATFKITEEQIFWESGPEYQRKGVEYTVSPTNQDWANYHLAKAGLLALRNYEGTLGLEEVEVPIPRPEVHYRFTETHEEWLDRCRTLQAERKAA